MHLRGWIHLDPQESSEEMKHKTIHKSTGIAKYCAYLAINNLSYLEEWYSLLKKGQTQLFKYIYSAT